MAETYWERVQRIEKKYHERKDPAAIRAINLVYWQRILEAAAAAGVRIGERSRVLDAGCGGAGVLLAVTAGTRVGVDPLMGFYLEKFPFLRDADVTWREGTAEELSSDEPFDVVFSINMLDHTIDPRASARNLVRLLAPGGHLVLVLNVHRTRVWRRYFALFYRFVDPPHPHHIHQDDVPAMFPGLETVERRDIDHLWLDLEERYRKEVCHREHGGPRRPGVKWLNAFLYPLAALRILLDRPVYRKRPDQTPLMASTLYVFRKPE